MLNDYLKKNWEQLTEGLPSCKDEFIEGLVVKYSDPSRAYHNLNHIEALLRYSEAYKSSLQAPRIVDFAIWYHDAIYDVLKSDNEEQSAELAKVQLTTLGLSNTEIDGCYDFIVATKSHTLPEGKLSFDAQFLMDIDLSILGAKQEDYIAYTKQIRSEYQIYPDAIYNPGRLKVLQHFLDMESIYKTDLFIGIWEEKARENLTWELGEIGFK